jgi:hypothetical protein
MSTPAPIPTHVTRADVKRAKSALGTFPAKGRRLYGVFWQQNNRPCWAMTTNMRRAIRKAKQVEGYVMWKSWPGPGAWDAPTFRSTSCLLFDATPDQWPTRLFTNAPSTQVSSR